jgi:hypothetical protein
LTDPVTARETRGLWPDEWNLKITGDNADSFENKGVEEKGIQKLLKLKE